MILHFDSRQKAYNFCVDEKSNIFSEKDLVIKIKDSEQNNSIDEKLLLDHKISSYDQVLELLDTLNKLDLKKDDIIWIVSNELLINALKVNNNFDSVEDLKKIKLTQEQSISFSIRDFPDRKCYRVHIIDQVGTLNLKDVIGCLDEKPVSPRLSGKFGAGHGLRIVSFYAISMSYSIVQGQSTSLEVDIPYRANNEESFLFAFKNITK